MTNPRGLLLAIGVTALGFLLVLGATAGMAFGAVAQTATPGGPTRHATDDADAKARAYDDFVAALATELGIGDVRVDAAIRTVLEEQVDDQEASGEIALKQASALWTVVDVIGAEGRRP